MSMGSKELKKRMHVPCMYDISANLLAVNLRKAACLLHHSPRKLVEQSISQLPSKLSTSQNA